MDNFQNFDTDQKKKIFDNDSKLEVADDAAALGVLAVAAPLLGGFAALVGINKISGVLATGQGGIIRHIQDIIRDEAYDLLTDVKIAVILRFMQGWWEQDGSRLVEGSFDKIGYNDPANKKSAIVKAMMEISKRRPDLFFNNLPSLEQFGYKRFGEKVTDRINKWLDDDPKIDIGDNVPGTPWTQAGENAFGIGDITEAFDSPSLSNAVGALASFYTGGLSSTPSAVKDLAFSLGLPGASKTIDKKWDDKNPSPIAPFKEGNRLLKPVPQKLITSTI